MEREIVLKKASKIIRKHLSEEFRILVFGSWAKGEAMENSDLDVGILGKEKVPWDDMVHIRQELDELPTLRSIDVVDLNSVEDNFRNNALKHAKSIGPANERDS